MRSKIRQENKSHPAWQQCELMWVILFAWPQIALHPNQTTLTKSAVLPNTQKFKIYLYCGSSKILGTISCCKNSCIVTNLCSLKEECVLAWQAEYETIVLAKVGWTVLFERGRMKCNLGSGENYMSYYCSSRLGLLVELMFINGHVKGVRAQSLS